MKIILLLIVLQWLYHLVVSDGYSFYKFSGPVSGPVYPITIQNPHNGHESIDYVAKPDYSYSYGVEDPETGNTQSRQETRDGDAVHGEYSLLQSDGTIRTVRYTADAINGFQASIDYSHS